MNLHWKQSNLKSRSGKWTHTCSLAVRLCLLVVTLLLIGNSVQAQKSQLSSEELKALQRVYVPEDQLGTVITKDRFGAVLSTEEFEKLLAEAIKLRTAAESDITGGINKGVAIHSANYDVHIDGDRLVGDLLIEMTNFEKDWGEVRLDITGWNIENALLGGKAPSIARDGAQQNVLRIFIDQLGKQSLKLSISTPLHANGSDKAASFRLANKASGEFRITLPAGKFLESTQLSLDRPSPAAEEATYVIPIGGQQQLSLKITDKKKSSQADVLTFASTAMGIKVLPSEITWVAKTQLQVFGQEIDQLTCLIPNLLEITAVESTGLESWELMDAPNDDSKTQITLQYRQGFEGQRGITFRGILSESPDEPWSVPTLIISNITSHTGTILVQHPENVRLQAIESAGVRAVNNARISKKTRPETEAQATFQIWDENFSLRFVAGLKKQEVQAAMTNVLDITQASLNLYTTVSVETRLAPLFDFRVRLPADWEVTTVQVDGKESQWQTVSSEAGINEIRVPLNPPLAPGQTRNVLFFSRFIPESWPVKDQTVRINIPEIRLPQADMVEALYGVSAANDFDVVTQEIKGLDPAGQKDIAILDQKLKVLGKSVRLGFTYQDTVFSGQLDVSRKPTSLAAETITFFRIDPENLFTRLEAILAVTGGGYRELDVLISEAAGEKLRFRLSPLAQQQNSRVVRLVEQIPGDVEDGYRRWTLRFDRYLQGNHRLSTEARTPREGEGPFVPVRLKFPDSLIVSGHLAVEGSPEEHVQLEAEDAQGKSLVAVDPVDFPKALYRPKERVVAGYRYIHPGWKLTVTTTEFDRSAVPTVIGHSANLTSVISKTGEFQHQANVVFTAIGAQSLLVKLPKEATLWSTLIDHKPVEIRKSAAGIQVPLAGLGQGQHTLQLAYSTLAPAMNTMGEFQTVPPSLSVIDGQGNQQPVEMLSQDWELYLPEETLLIASNGLFEPVGRLFESNIFSELVDLFKLPSQRRAFNRGISVLIAVAVLFVIWWVLRTRVVNKLTTSRKPLGIFLFVASFSFVLFVILLFSARHSSLEIDFRGGSVSQYETTAEPTSGVGVDHSHFSEVAQDMVDSPSMSIQEELAENEAMLGGAMTNDNLSALPGIVPGDRELAATRQQVKRRSRIPSQRVNSSSRTGRPDASNGLFASTNTLNLIDRKNWSQGSIAGLSRNDSFSSDLGGENKPGKPAQQGVPQPGVTFSDQLDIPFRQGSFDLVEPSFGGADPRGGALPPFGSTDPSSGGVVSNAPPQPENAFGFRANSAANKAMNQQVDQVFRGGNSTIPNSPLPQVEFNGRVVKPSANENDEEVARLLLTEEKQRRSGQQGDAGGEAQTERGEFLFNRQNVVGADAPAPGEPSQRNRFGRMSTGGLLSMTFDLQIPEGTRSQSFHYQGNGLNSEEINLRVRFANRTTGLILVWSIALGIALLGWWLRMANTGMKVFWVGLTILLPISVAWVVPALWQMLLEGVLFGGIVSLLLWGLYLGSDCCKCCCGWFSKKTCPASLLLVIGSMTLLSCSTLNAAEKPVAKSKKKVAPPVVVQREPFVVVPFESLAEIDAADRIWVPHNIYRQLWEASHPEDIPAIDGPITSTISEANYVATLKQVGEEQHVAIQARWVVSIMTDKQVSVVLPITGSAISNALVNGETATTQPGKTNQTNVILKGRGVHVVDALLTIKANVNGDVGEFSVQRLPVASGLFTFELPKSENELRVRVNGTEKAYRRITDGEKTLISIPIDRGGKMTLAWYPQAQQGGQNQIVQVETAIAASIDDTGLSVNHAFVARVRQGGRHDLSFAVPENLSVREIAGNDVGGWEVKDAEAGKELKVFFRREVTDQTEFHVNLFRPIEIGAGAAALPIPTIAPQDVSRETVQLALYAAAHLQLRVTSTAGLSQINISRYKPVVSPQGPKQNPLFAYRSSSRPLELNVSIQRREPLAKMEVEHGVHIARRKQLIASRIVWQLTGSPRRRVDVEIPDDYLPIDVVCAESADWYVHQAEQGKILTIEFSTPRLGRIEAGLEGHIAKQPGDTNVEINLPRPVESSGQSATLGIWLDAAYQASIAETGDWKSLRPNQVSANYQKLDKRPVQFAFRSDEDAPKNVVLNVQTATPKLTGDAVTLIAVSDATIDYGLTLRWNISQAATDQFVFTLPDWLSNIEITGQAVRQIQSEDAGEGRKRWTVSLVDPVRNQYLLSIAATIPAPTDQTVQTPHVEFQSSGANGEYARLQVQQQYAILVNLSPSQLVPVDLEQFESVSVDRLPLVVNQELVQQAMEMTRVRAEKRPSWSIERLEEHTIAKAVVLSAHLETVLETDGSWRTLATYGIRNRGRQFLALRLPAESRILSVFVRGKAARTVVSQINEQTTHLIALPQTSAVDLSFDVKLLLAGRFDRSLVEEFSLRGKQLSLPSPEILSQNESEEFGLPVTQTLWTVHLPEEVDAKFVSGVASTNLTPHAANVWLAIERQTLKRLETDLTEMSRILTDKSASMSKRTQARNNMRQIGLALHSYNDFYLSNPVIGGKETELRESLIEGNRFLQKQAEKAAEEVIPEVIILDDGVPQQGRAFIFLNNGGLIKSNTVGGIPGVDANIHGNTLNFNFIQTAPKDSAKKSEAKSRGKAAASRSKLKSQIAGQGLVNNFDSNFANGITITDGNFNGIGIDYDFNISGADASQVEIQLGNVQSNTAAQQRVTGSGLSGGSYGGGQQGGMATNQVPQDENQDGVTIFHTFGSVIGSSEETASAKPWTSAGGLSIAMDLPKNATTLSFSKVGGNPQLTLSIQPARSNQLLWGIGWCFASLMIGLRVLRSFRSVDSTRGFFKLLAKLVIVTGLVGFFFLSGDIVALFFWIFCFGGFVFALLARPVEVAAATP